MSLVMYPMAPKLAVASLLLRGHVQQTGERLARAVYYITDKNLHLQHYNLRLYASRQGPRNTMEAKEISDRLLLHRALSRAEWQWPGDPKRVLVLFFPWLNAKEKHVDRYRELYTSLGLDVLTVKSLPSDFLWPPNSFRLAKHTIKALQDRLHEYDHYILHSMSIGSYNLTILSMLARQHNSQKHILDKFRGIIFDSIVVGAGRGGVIKEQEHSPGDAGEPVHAIDRMIKGVAKSVSKSSVVQSLITLMAKMYFGATKKHTVDFYEKALDVVRDEPVIVPTLVFASKDDPMSDAVVLQKLVDIWKTNSNLPVTLRLWDSSPHAQHYIYHTEEYQATQKEFFSHVFATRMPSEEKSKL